MIETNDRAETCEPQKIMQKSGYEWDHVRVWVGEMEEQETTDSENVECPSHSEIV